MKDQHIVIVGGTSGIGREITSNLLQAGAHVTAISRKNEGLPDGAKHLVWDATSDFTQESELPEAIDGLVYCPGSINLKQFRSLEVADFQNDFELNVLGAVRILKPCLKRFKKAGNASVVLFSTVAAAQGMPFHASIATAKAGLEGLVKSLAAEWAPRVRVNAVALSLTDTPLAKGLLSSESKRESADARHPLRRVGTPRDAAQAARFLLSDESSWISGQVLGVDGGMSTLRV
ncbi:MAG: SDR family oxidoreductase [Bacteroidetes bacterium]|nr:SDR family oxidoreductase [Bacteroidota bacterium]